ncbi:cytochrome P450 [Mycobacterium sp. pV006]|uniref:cytochrome P450 n=1 Tax=Mycobacterium sp. pV006 TaxID=3238983 RepID=UPI00351B57A4
MTKQLCPIPVGSQLKPIHGSGAPGLVELLRTVADRKGATRRNRERFGDIAFHNLMGRKCVLPLTPETAEPAIINRSKAFANAPAWEYLIGMVFKRGLLLMDFDDHRHQRLIFQQAFTSDSLKGYLREMQPVLRNALEQFPTGNVRLAEEFKAINLDTALSVFVGVDLSRADADRINGAFLDCLRGPTAMVRYPIPGGAVRRAARGREVLVEFFAGLLPEKRRHESNDLFSILCRARSDEGGRFSDDQIIDHMIFLLFAAHDTSTSALSTMAYYMAKHPQWQQRARVQSLQLPADLTFDHLKEMSCLDLILKESLRLNAPVPVLAREAIEDTELAGYFVPKGTLVFVSPEAVHENPNVWHQPLAFDPERFTPERAEDKSHRFAWFPFGGGVHKCIGLYFAQMEIKSVMHNSLRRYQWSIAEDYVWKIDRRTLGDPVGGLPAVVRPIG